VRPSPAPAQVHGRDRDRASRRHERHRPADGGILERRSAVDEEGLQGLAEVADEMKAVDDLDRLGCPPANPVGVVVAPIATDDRDRRMSDQPGGDTGGRAVRQQVYDSMRHEIDQDGAIPKAPPPGPLVDADCLQGCHGSDRNSPYQPEQHGSTGRRPQAGREPGSRLPAQRHANRQQDGDEPSRVAGGWRHEIWQALCEDVACAVGLTAHELPYREPDMDGARAPGEIGQLALVTAMSG
jgi:hypothetical protein